MTGWFLMASASSGLRDAGLVEDRIGDAYLADVVEDPADPEGIYVPWGQVHRPAEVDREARNPSCMALGVGVLCLDGARQGEEDVLDADEAVVQPFGLDEGAHPGGKLHPVRGLGDEVVGARLDCPDPGVGVVQGGDHDHGDHARRRVGLQPSACFEAVHSGHHGVEEDQVDVAGRERLQGLLAVAGDDRFAVERLEHGLEDLRVHRFVVDDEDAETPSRTGGRPNRQDRRCLSHWPLRATSAPLALRMSSSLSRVFSEEAHPMQTVSSP